MKRELKFRAWCETDRGDEMVYFGKVECDNGLWFDSPIDHIDEYHAVMQYTGLKDKNGKEIYEGDILIGTILSGLEHSTGGAVQIGIGTTLKVEFYEGAFRCFKKNNRRKFNLQSNNIKISGLEVIGNIYENPDLLK